MNVYHPALSKLTNDRLIFSSFVTYFFKCSTQCFKKKSQTPPLEQTSQTKAARVPNQNTSEARTMSRGETSFFKKRVSFPLFLDTIFTLSFNSSRLFRQGKNVCAFGREGGGVKVAHIFSSLFIYFPFVLLQELVQGPHPLLASPAKVMTFGELPSLRTVRISRNKTPKGDAVFFFSGFPFFPFGGSSCDLPLFLFRLGVRNTRGRQEGKGKSGEYILDLI